MSPDFRVIETNGIRLRAAVQYWNSYFETGGPTRKLWSAVDALHRADCTGGEHELFDVVRSIHDEARIVKVMAVAKQDTRAGAPLQLEFRIAR